MDARLKDLIEHPSNVRFHAILKELADLHNLKQRDYGHIGEPFYNYSRARRFDLPPWVSCILRMDEKMARLENFIKTGNLSNESFIDSLTDIAVIAVIARVLYEEAQNESKQAVQPR